MISYVKGRLIEKTANHLVVLVGGLGLEVRAPAGTIDKAPEVGNEITLYTCLHVRQDVMRLYGFESPGARELFMQLTSVSGFGSAKALSVLSVFSPDGFVQVVRDGDAEALTVIPGIGRKSAERLLLEMKDKVGPLLEEAPAVAPAMRRSMDEAAAVLEELGYSRREAFKALNRYPIGEGEPGVEEILKFVLRSKARELARKEVPRSD